MTAKKVVAPQAGMAAEIENTCRTCGGSRILLGAQGSIVCTGCGEKVGEKVENISVAYDYPNYTMTAHSIFYQTYRQCHECGAHTVELKYTDKRGNYILMCLQCGKIRAKTEVEVLTRRERVAIPPEVIVMRRQHRYILATLKAAKNLPADVHTPNEKYNGTLVLKKRQWYIVRDDGCAIVWVKLFIDRIDTVTVQSLGTPGYTNVYIQMK